VVLHLADLLQLLRHLLVPLLELRLALLHLLLLKLVHLLHLTEEMLEEEIELLVLRLHLSELVAQLADPRAQHLRVLRVELLGVLHAVAQSRFLAHLRGPAAKAFAPVGIFLLIAACRRSTCVSFIRLERSWSCWASDARQLIIG